MYPLTHEDWDHNFKEVHRRVRLDLSTEMIWTLYHTNNIDLFTLTLYDTIPSHKDPEKEPIQYILNKSENAPHIFQLTNSSYFISEK